jgi:hypothetical protein
MKADFTRNTFDPTKHFSRVVMQHGRVQLDADWNEQTAILLHYLQTLAADLIGPHGGPEDNCGFQITYKPANGTKNNQPDLAIGAGRYYVDGILCENLAEMTYYEQVHYPLNPDTEKLPNPPYLVYLDVWERLVTAVEDDSIREVALGGADTAARAQVVWQVKVANTLADGKPILVSDIMTWQPLPTKEWNQWLNLWQPTNRGLLAARTREIGNRVDDACITPPDARYRGAENQLYRVEIHKGGDANNATFKWSRDNGSVLFPIRHLRGNIATVEGLGRDSRFTLQPGDWVEIVDDDYILHERAEPLLKVSSVDHGDMQVTLEGTPASLCGQNPARHPFLRRWDHKAGAENQTTLKIHEGQCLDLEDGIQIQFEADPTHTYRTGDYWLIPARTATGDVEWPRNGDKPRPLPPHGVEHHYAPLALIKSDGTPVDYRHKIGPASQPVGGGLSNGK